MMTDPDNFKLNYTTRRRIINLLDHFNEYLLIKKLNCKDIDKQSIETETNSLIDQVNSLELINSNQPMNRKSNNEIYLDLNENSHLKISHILLNNKYYCLDNFDKIKNDEPKMKKIIDENRKLISDLVNLNDFNYSIFIKGENDSNQINSSSNLNQNNSIFIKKENKNQKINSTSDLNDRNIKLELNNDSQNMSIDDDNDSDIIEIIEIR